MTSPLCSPDHPQTSLFSRRRTLLMLSASTVLAACGGGGSGGNSGGGGGSPTPTPTPSPTPTPTPTASGPAWSGYGRDAQHSAISAIASQDLAKVAWSANVDLAPQYTPGGALLTHYGSPVISKANTVVIPVKTGASGGYRLEGRNGATGALLWTQDSDYVAPPHNWVPPYNLLLTEQGRLLAPGAGGKLLIRDNPDSATAAVTSLVFFSAAAYDANPTAFDTTVFINTPLTADANGNIFFGFRVTGTNPAGLVSGIARVAPDGSGNWVSAAAAAGDPAIQKPAMNCAPALSNDGSTVYIAVNLNPASGVVQTGYLLALDSTTLATKAKADLIDPAAGTRARISDDATSAPVVGPDGRVFYGVLESQFPTHNARGWLLQFDSMLNPVGFPGSFGWDVSPSIVPAGMVPSYDGTSTYLLAQKYNNYAGVGSGDGLNRMAVLDPKTAQADPVIQSVQVMREVLTILSPKLDGTTPASRPEWCINTMAVDLERKSVLANNEDGVLYRWDLSTNTLTQSLKLNSGLGQAYTPTAIGADGGVFAISNAVLYAVRAS